MNKKIQSLIKNVGILAISNFASKIMVFLLVPLYTSILTTAEYGTYDLVVSTVQLLFPLLTLNITDAVMRFSMDKAYSVEDIVTIGLKYIVSSFCVVILFLSLCGKFKLFAGIGGYEFLIGLYFVFYIANQFLIQLTKGLEKVIDMGIAGVLGTIFLLGGNLLLLLRFHCGLVGFFIANILAQAIPTIYFCIRIRIWRYIRFNKTDKVLNHEMLVYCFPLIFSTIGWWVNNASDKYIVAFICGASANGLLSVSYKIPSIINVIQSIFIQAWQISAIKEYGEKDNRKFYGKTFGYVNLFMCFCCAGLILLAKPIGSILYSNDFFTAWRYVPFLLISSVLNSASGLLGPILSAAKNSNSMAKSAIYGAVSNVILSIVFIKWWGIQGATIATVIASYITYRVRKQATGDMIEIKSYRKVLLTWGILCIQATVEILYCNIPMQLILILILLIINKEIVMDMCKYISRLFYRKNEKLIA